MNYLTVDKMLELLSKGRSIWGEGTRGRTVEYKVLRSVGTTIVLERSHVRSNNYSYTPTGFRQVYNSVEELRAALTTLGDCLADKPVLDLFYVPRWNKSIPPQGVLCWVGDSEVEVVRKDFLLRVIGYNEGASMP